MKRNPFSKYTLLIILVFILAMVILAELEISAIYEPPLLLAVLNTFFIGLFPIAVAVIAARASSKGGPAILLWMGSGMLVFGAGSIIAGWVVPIDPNFTVTIHNISALFGGLFHAVGALISLNPVAPAARQNAFFRGRTSWVISYATILAGLAVLAYAVITRIPPPFFIQGSGSTSIRQVVLGLGIVFYVFSASIFLSLYLKSRTLFLYWYFIALSLIACGLLAVLAQNAVGSPLGWLGRSAQYLGGVFAVVSILAVKRSSAQTKTTIENIIASYFIDPQAGYRALEELVSARTAALEKEITERKRAEAGALASQKLAGIGSLAAGMAHEINSPLQMVTGLSERLTRNLNAGEFDQEQFLTDIEAINRNGWRIAKIIRSLLTYARQDFPEIVPQQLNDIIESSLPLIEHQMQSWSNISIEKELAADLPLVHCDSNSITQVIINLLENARDAMPGGGWIRISTACSPENEQVTLRISDTGEGIPTEIQSRIFEPFFTTKEVGKGTGLGLSIVHGIVEAHGGEITIESAPGKGITFRICFPKEAPLKADSNNTPNGRYN